MLKQLLQIIGFAAVASAQGTGFPEQDRVNELWQQPDLSFGFYSGYLPIAGTKKELHYVAALSRNDPMNDPVIIWFNGGVGCSSMIGWANEHGPYFLAAGAENFTFNDWSWNNNANMIYIDAPAGAGYSICGDPSECKFDDANSADDNLEAVLALLQTKFTALQNNDLYISGESYGGVFVPQLALRIDKYITNAKPTDWKPNFRGFMVGNGVTNWKYDCDPAYFHMAYYHGLISDSLKDNFTAKNCDFSYINSPNPPVITPQCKEIFQKFVSQVALVNEWDIFGKCYKSSSGSLKASQYTAFRGKHSTKDRNFKYIPPCVYNGLILDIDYFNNPLVRQQLNIKNESGKWDLCTNSIDYTPLQNASQWIYVQLKGKYKILKYSGDTDGGVPTYGTQGWLADLGWSILDQWRPYYITNIYGQQVAGYVERYEGGLTFATVHGAGHMAPKQKRQETYHAVFNFINNMPL